MKFFYIIKVITVFTYI